MTQSQIKASITQLTSAYWQAHYADDDVKASEIRCKIEELQSELKATEYADFRKDGWPLCPRCGMDELQNPELSVSIAEATPTLKAFLDHGLWCLACHWESNAWQETHK
jgi:hypothetical protein